jgi:hypothetical protein
MIEFKFIEPDQLRQWWMSVKPGLEEIKKRSPENWIPEDVYADCWNSKSFLYVALKDSHFAGYFVLQPINQKLHVWAAWTLENDYQLVEKGLQFTKDMAREANIKYLSFSSHRPGWNRRAKAYGFRPREWISEV